MTAAGPRSPRRAESLSRERIVAEAVRVLDERGEGELTFRALTRRLATGAGAIYWHVPSKDELLAAATSTVVSAALDASAGTAADSAPQTRIRAAALGLFDAVVEHPWLASQLPAQVSRSAWGAATPRLFDRFGREVGALGVPQDEWFTATSVLVHYVLGAVGQNGSNADALPADVDRTAFLDAAAAAWEALDEADYPVAHVIAGQLRDHDDREQFLAGIDIIVAGLVAQAPRGADVD